MNYLGLDKHPTAQMARQRAFGQINSIFSEGEQRRRADTRGEISPTSLSELVRPIHVAETMKEEFRKEQEEL